MSCIVFFFLFGGIGQMSVSIEREGVAERGVGIFCREELCLVSLHLSF